MSGRRSGGGQLVTWDTVATVFAMITPRNTNAYLRALYPSAKTIHKITIRYRDDIAVNMRIQYGVRYFNIVSIINDDEADKWLMIDAIETAEAAA